jgi:alpha-glucosidase
VNLVLVEVGHAGPDLRIRRGFQKTLLWYPSPEEVLVFGRSPGLVCAANLGDTPVTLPDYGDLLLSSAPVDGRVLPPDTTAWYSESVS